jgi:hypothetical protein
LECSPDEQRPVTNDPDGHWAKCPLIAGTVVMETTGWLVFALDASRRRKK